jgi:hypothetical protein
MGFFVSPFSLFVRLFFSLSIPTRERLLSGNPEPFEPSEPFYNSVA